MSTIVVFNNQDVDGGLRASVGVFIGAVGGAFPSSWGGASLGVVAFSGPGAGRRESGE